MRIRKYIVLVTIAATSLFCAFFASTLAQAQAEHRSLPTRHVREEVKNGQAPRLSGLPGEQRIGLAVMLPLRNQAGLGLLLQQLYDARSPSYRQYLTVQEFTERFGPTQDDYNAAMRFAEANGMTVTNTAPNRLVLDVTAPVSSIEKAFHVTMGIYQHPTENRTFYAPDREPTVDLDVPLWHIAGLDNFSIPRTHYMKAEAGSAVRSNTTGSGPGGSFLGSDRRAAYYGGTALTGSGQSLGLFELGGYNLSDVTTYFANIGQSFSSSVLSCVQLLGASCTSDGDDTEQVIDIIDAISMAPGLSEILVYIAPNSGFSVGTSDTDIFNRMATDNIAKQLSVSWLWRPDDPSKNDTIFQELAAQGQSLFVASGDYGSWPDSSDPYYYPAEDANVTAVGGTDLTTNSAGGSWASEIAFGGANIAAACPQGKGAGSAGGISPDSIAIPTYQQLTGVINSSNSGSTTLRNVPDVAAEANCDNYYCANGSCGDGLGGTSLATPTWAGFIALVNQQSVANGNSTVGFLNPIIYPIGVGSNYSSDFHDITVGDNFNSHNKTKYSAVTGYDLVTGWGSPNGQNLINALAGVP